MDELFDEHDGPAASPDPFPGRGIPLAARMRPQTLDEYAGQQHILGQGKLLRRAVEADRFTSLIFYGPPGVGKTSLAQLIARRTESRFVNLSGVESNVADIRKAVEAAESLRRMHGRPTTLFVDEIHRFNKSQQDVLLPWIERGTVRFIGATTHNPFFYVNSPLVSRSQVFQLEPLANADIEAVLRRALSDDERGLGSLAIQAHDNALSHLATMADGDARKALTALELAVLTTPPDAAGVILIDLAAAEESIQRKTVVYDADGDAHYDTISAFIKSIRGSDPDAALYWLAKMLHAGEDFRFIARRLVIAASEDIGLADSNALRVAIDAWQAAEFVGLPEGRIPLAHATVYLATAPKRATVPTPPSERPSRTSPADAPSKFPATSVPPPTREPVPSAMARATATHTITTATSFPRPTFRKAVATMNQQATVRKPASASGSISGAANSRNTQAIPRPERRVISRAGG